LNLLRFRCQEFGTKLDNRDFPLLAGSAQGYPKKPFAGHSESYREATEKNDSFLVYWFQRFDYGLRASSNLTIELHPVPKTPS
jgi:hypothetical protein